MTIHDWAEIAGCILFIGVGIGMAGFGFLISTLAIHVLIDAWLTLRWRPEPRPDREDK